MRTQELINNELVTHIFEPKILDPTRQQLLVMGNELGARLFVDADRTQLSDGGRLAQHVANHLSVPVLAYLRPGTEGSRDPLYLAAAYRGLSVENHHDFAIAVGKTLRNRILLYEQRDRQRGTLDPVLVSKSAGCLLNAAIGATGHAKTIAPVAGIYIEAAGLHRFGGLWRTRQQWEEYNARVESVYAKPPRPDDESGNAEPASRWRQTRDMLLYGRLMASDATAHNLRCQAQPTTLELAERGMYSSQFPDDRVGSLRLVDTFNDLVSLNDSPHPQFATFVHTFHDSAPDARPWRGKITHGYYNGSAEYAGAITRGLVRLGIWQPGRPPR